jgi:hypothetical protein
MYTLTGKALSGAELEQIPTVLRFHVTQRTHLDTDQKATVSSEKKSGFELEPRTSAIFQCPVGPHSDPGLSGAVSRALLQLFGMDAGV